MTEREDSSLFDRSRESVLEAIRAGLTVDEAASSGGLSVNTVRSWLSRGRKAPTGPYGRFASEVDAVRELRRLPDRSEMVEMTRVELELLLADKIRAGSVPAMRLWLDLHRDDDRDAGRDGFAEFDAQGLG